MKNLKLIVAVALLMTGSATMNAQTTNLDSLTIMLGDVLVKGHKPVYRLSEEGLRTNVQGTVLEKLGTAKEVLAHVPGVVKEKDAIEVAGKGAPLIYINGRQMRDDNELETLKADDIKSVELISEPGAKYSANVHAVIKIKTKKQKGEGFGGDVRSSVYRSENTDLVNNVNLTYRKKGWDVFGTLYHGITEREERTNIMMTLKSNKLWQQEHIQLYKPKYHSLKTTLGTNYAINDSNSIGVKYNYSCNLHDRSNISSVSKIYADGEYYDGIDAFSHREDADCPHNMLNAYYNGTIGRLNVDFNTDYVFIKEADLSVQKEDSRNYDNRTITSFNNVKNRMIASKLVLTYPLLGGRLSWGAELIRTKRNDDFINPEAFVATSYSLLKESSIAPFMEYAKNTPIGSVSAGLRYEHVKFDYYVDGKHIEEQSRKFSNLFPNIGINKEIGNVQLSLSYSVKTVRPTYSQLRNSTFYGNRMLMESGNPCLKHELVHDISVRALWKFINLYVDYDDHRDAIIPWAADDSNGNPDVAHISNTNLRSLKGVTAILTIAPKIGVWSPELTFNVRKQWLKLDVMDATIHFNKPRWRFIWNNAFDFGKGWLATFDSYLYGKGNTANYEFRKLDLYTNASVKKSFLKDKLSVTLGCYDVFHTFRYPSTAYLGNFMIDNISHTDSRDVYLTLRYKFNAMRSKYKGSGAGNAERNRF